MIDLTRLFASVGAADSCFCTCGSYNLLQACVRGLVVVLTVGAIAEALVTTSRIEGANAV